MQLFDLQPWQCGQVPKKTVRKELAASASKPGCLAVPSLIPPLFVRSDPIASCEPRCASTWGGLEIGHTSWRCLKIEGFALLKSLFPSRKDLLSCSRDNALTQLPLSFLPHVLPKGFNPAYVKRNVCG